MQLIVYLLVYPLLYLLSLLPFRLLYSVSDGVYVLVYHVVGFRKKIVSENLKLAFPDKTDQERLTIQKKFYHHLCDILIEMIKSITASEKELTKRFIFKNPEELRRLESLNKSVVVMYGHYASYEWSIVITHYIGYRGYGIYKPLKNKYFDKLARRLRSKYNTQLISMRETVDYIVESEQQGIRSMTGFMSDQSPKRVKLHHWTKFMGIDVPCHTGAEMLAKKLDLSVTFLKIDKVKRGYYEAEFVPLADNANDYADYEITEKFTKALEAQIYDKPEFYLWTHRRWKHRKPKS